MAPDRDDAGQFASRVSDQDVLRALSAHPEPVATASDLADPLGVSAETVRRHLSSLSEAGRVERKAVGARAVVWWVVTREETHGLEESVRVTDPFFTAEPFEIEDPIAETEIDDVLYGASEP
jgi:DNA-binding MarR family transcriptional regulator